MSHYLIIFFVILAADSTILGHNSLNKLFSTANSTPSGVEISQPSKSLHM